MTPIRVQYRCQLSGALPGSGGELLEVTLGKRVAGVSGRHDFFPGRGLLVRVVEGAPLRASRIGAADLHSGGLPGGQSGMRGMPAKIDRIMEIRPQAQASVIETWAQANGGTSAESRWARSATSVLLLQFHKDHHSGEGRVLATNADLLYTRAQAYHDVAAPAGARTASRRPRFAGRDLLRRELPHERAHRRRCPGAVRKLDSIVSRMRRNKEAQSRTGCAI